MSIALSERTRIAAKSAMPWVSWSALGLGVALIAANLTLHDTLFHRGAPTPEVPGDAPAPADAAPAEPTAVTLTEDKLKAAGIATAKADLITLPAELGVPGKIEANQDHQVLVRPRAGGVIREVKAVLGQSVKKGDVLAVLDSADVGTARLDLRARQRELGTARLEADFKAEVAANVATLIPELRKNVEPADIDKTYGGRTLGAYRATLLSSYSKYAVARHEEEKTTGLFRREIIGEHPLVVATHTREAAQAEFEAAVEQARYDANQQSLLANQRVRQAEAAVIDAGQRLRILGVPEDVKALLAQAGKVAASLDQSAGEDVTTYPILAPFDGTLITKSAVPSQKADVNDVLFTLADLSTVWVMANIPESDFAMLPALQAGTIRLEAAAYPGRSFQAKVLSVGATVDPATRTVAMLAETPNTDALLKLGMFVRITLDTAVEAKALSVPAAAVVEIEGRKGVFVPDAADAHAFHFRPVKLGRESGDRQVIVSGIAAGDAVVSRGAFYLKSELILQNEGDEE